MDAIKVVRYRYLLIFFWIWNVTSSSVQFHLITDSRLCNNGDLPRYSSSMCADPHNRNNVFECDQRKIPAEECREVAVETNVFSHKELMELVPTIDSDTSIRRIVVKMDIETVDIDAVAKEIDDFLTRRLWWYAHKEPFHWNKHSHKIIVLDRVQHHVEKGLRMLGALQFPPSPEVCAKSALLFNHRDFNHPGWYSMLAVFSIVHGEMPFAITAMYVSSQNSVNDSTSFISGSDCPSVVNKWECAFLRTTDCPLPTLITDCTEFNCVQNIVQDTRWSTAIFDSASASGRLLAVDTTPFAEAKERSSKPPDFNPHYLEESAATESMPSPVVRYGKPYSPAHVPFQSMMLFDADLYTYNLILRPSAFYRSRIAEAIKEFRIVNNFTSADRCVAAQIRRGDRALPGVNITEFCMRPENRNSDMGCAEVPFASVTLQHVVDSAAHLVEPVVRTLIVTTDDEEWLDAQRIELRKTRPDWTVLNLKAPRHHHQQKQGPADEDYDYMRFKAGTASGVLLHGSIEASRQCEAFVGHFGCGGTMLVYKSLCAQHNHREYVCPPSLDVRTIRELRLPHAN